MTDEELEAIRAEHEYASRIRQHHWPLAYTHRAALLAEVDRLRAVDRAQHNAISTWTARGLKLESENKRLREQLRRALMEES